MHSATGKSCPYCQFPLKEQDAIVVCSECAMPHHQECWTENRGCTTYGCEGDSKASSDGLVHVERGTSGIDSSNASSFCTHCGNALQAGNQYCTTCGAAATGSIGKTSLAPISGQPINNKWVWMLAFAPIIGTIAESLISGAVGIASSALWFITVFINLVLSMFDERDLKKAGHDTSRMGAFWLVPVYLFKRAKKLNQKSAYAIVWCITFAVVVSAPFLATESVSIPSYTLSDPAVNSVKHGTLYSYPDRTVGQMVDGYFGNPRWESIVASDGNTYVNATGRILYAEKQVQILIQYKLNGDSTFELQAVEMNGVPQNMLFYTALLDAMYGP